MLAWLLGLLLKPDLEERWESHLAGLTRYCSTRLLLALELQRKTRPALRGYFSLPTSAVPDALR
jgi:hypothetical protein